MRAADDRHLGGGRAGRHALMLVRVLAGRHRRRLLDELAVEEAGSAERGQRHVGDRLLPGRAVGLDVGLLDRVALADAGDEAREPGRAVVAADARGRDVAQAGHEVHADAAEAILEALLELAGPVGVRLAIVGPERGRVSGVRADRRDRLAAVRRLVGAQPRQLLLLGGAVGVAALVVEGARLVLADLEDGRAQRRDGMRGSST